LHQGRSRRSPWFFIGLEWPFASSRLTTFATLRRQRRFHARPIRIKKGGVSFPTQTLSSSSFFGQDSLNSFLLGFRNSGSHQSPPAADQPLAEPSSGLRQSEISKRELFPTLAVYLPQKTIGTIPRPRFADSGSTGFSLSVTNPDLARGASVPSNQISRELSMSLRDRTAANQKLVVFSQPKVSSMTHPTG
jgi:hypothetical protein